MTKPIQIKNLLIGSGLPKVCVPLTSQTREELGREAAAAKAAGADLVEWRADFYENLTDAQMTLEVLKELSDILGQIPLLFTIRTKEEGGSCQISTRDYVNLNIAAAQSQKADFVDVEVFGEEEEKKALITEIQSAGAKVIASSHDFEKTDDQETLLKRFQDMDATGADILKIAVMPNEFEDVAAIMQATSRMSREFTEKPLISMAMGSLGSISRIAGENFGSSVTFAAVGAASAPGQFPIRELRMMMDALHEKNRTEDSPRMND
ncbi:MAG: type I 3-dehydroquinate dehydratase [Eubacteriales bacterium]|nr:type I 3-dehydroquinate dehydratase [Eubacteriales bacterium]